MTATDDAVTATDDAVTANNSVTAHNDAANATNDAANATNDIARVAARLLAAGVSEPHTARCAVNVPMVHNWVEAIGDRCPVYTDEAAARSSVHGGLVAPPAMLQVWTMPGLHPVVGPNPFAEMLGVLDAAGYTGVVATDCEQTYHRYLRPGDHLTVRLRLSGVAGPKTTALGEGYFVTTVHEWRVADEVVGEMLFRVLKFKIPDRVPESVPGKEPGALRPVVDRDTRFFWDGARAGELRVQRCTGCGALRHPPGPMCPRCHGTSFDHVRAAGTGTVFSYVVHHHPPVPGRRTPFAVALVELPEGVRITGTLVGVAPDAVRVGMPVQVCFEKVDDELTLPCWRPAGEGGG